MLAPFPLKGKGPNDDDDIDVEIGNWTKLAETKEFLIDH